jgi:hypothetical protein
VPLRLVLARTDDVVVAIVGASAYSSGIELRIAIRRRPRPWRDLDNEDMGAFFGGDPFETPFGRPHLRMNRGRELPPALLRFGVQFSDGRKATTVGDMFPWDYGLDEDRGEEPPGPVLMQGGGGGGNGEWESGFWLWPMPPPGPVAFVVEWPAQQVELARQEVDAALFLDAAAKSEVLWSESEGTRQSTGFGGTSKIRGGPLRLSPHEEGPAEDEEESD